MRVICQDLSLQFVRHFCKYGIHCIQTYGAKFRQIRRFSTKILSVLERRLLICRSIIMSMWLLALSQKMLISARVNAAVFSSATWIRRYLNICLNTALRKVCPFWSRVKTASHRLLRRLDFPIRHILERCFIRWWDARRAIIESLSFQRHRKYSQTIWQKFPKDIIIFCRYREHRFVLREKTEKIFSKLQKHPLQLWIR